MKKVVPASKVTPTKNAAETKTKSSSSKVVLMKSAFDSYSEQDTADKLILPYLAATHGSRPPTASIIKRNTHWRRSPGRRGATMDFIFQAAIRTSCLRRSAMPTILTTAIFSRRAPMRPQNFSTSRSLFWSCRMAASISFII